MHDSHERKVMLSQPNGNLDISLLTFSLCRVGEPGTSIGMQLRLQQGNSLDKRKVLDDLVESIASIIMVLVGGVLHSIGEQQRLVRCAGGQIGVSKRKISLCAEHIEWKTIRTLSKMDKNRANACNRSLQFVPRNLD